jgi:hypothetical protein
MKIVTPNSKEDACNTAQLNIKNLVSRFRYKKAWFSKNHSKLNLQGQFNHFFVRLAEKFAKSGNMTPKIVSQYFQNVHNFYTF